ncbi:unnamed protein product [Ceutorhynchus assimilis]|uniref:ABC transporter domain-containing protein n=1 Tax=Ceutorhynchus assimilis TaxID=467358 RepID=A0A9N9QIU0_9CUCU|nr:unnamed protein product [Ceutorhynchus assimilis]
MKTKQQSHMMSLYVNFIFTWANLKYSLEEKQGTLWNQSKIRKNIIDGVSGFATSGSVTAILGASGCGKTTLLTLLSGQRKGHGTLRINGRIVSAKMLRNNSTFLLQKDLFIETLTVQEHLTFMAAMCLHKPYHARSIEVQTLLKTFSLENSKCTQITFLSTGEKRKLSLASNLLLEPYILFCDEPTTGIDSFNAVSVVKILKTVASLGKIVFLTAHQPSSPLFELFDNVILLSPHGKVVFHGSKENARSFFEGQFLFCPMTYNPADYYIKNIVIKSPADEKKVNDMIEVFNKNRHSALNLPDYECDALLLKQKYDEKNFFYTLAWLSWRVYIDAKRYLFQYLTTLLLILITAFIIGISYSSTIISGFSGVQSIQGALLLIVSELIFNGMYQVIYIFPSEIEIFIKEKNIYAALPYFVSKIVSLVPFAILYSLGFLVAYFICLTFLTGGHLFVQMYLILLGASVGGSTLGLCLSALFPTIESMHLFIVPLDLLCLLLSGLWIRIGSLSKFFAAIKYLSPFYVSFESLSIVYWLKADEMDLCPVTENVPCYRNGTAVLENYDFTPSYEKVFQNLMYLCFMIILYSCIGYIAILRKRAIYQI